MVPCSETWMLHQRRSAASQKHVMRIRSLTSQEKISSGGTARAMRKAKKETQKKRMKLETMNRTRKSKDQRMFVSSWKEGHALKIWRFFEVLCFCGVSGLLQTRPGSSLHDLTGWASRPESSDQNTVCSEGHVVCTWHDVKERFVNFVAAWVRFI